MPVAWLLALHLTIQATPLVSFAPAHVRVMVRIVASPDNRTLVIEAEAANSYRRTDIPLEGELAMLTHYIDWRAMGPGAYTVQATVLDSVSSVLDSARTQLRVIGGGE